jgi:hypothetical protein
LISGAPGRMNREQCHRPVSQAYLHGVRVRPPLTVGVIPPCSRRAARARALL